MIEIVGCEECFRCRGGMRGALSGGMSKLAFHPESIRVLSSSELAAAEGGFAKVSSRPVPFPHLDAQQRADMKVLGDRIGFMLRGIQR